MTITETSASKMTAADGSGSSLIDGVGRDTFLKLLVAQVRNQDPLNPQDPTEFVTQLANFSSLETLLDMRASLEGILEVLGAATQAAPGGETNNE